ncbi:Protein RRP6-like 2 [Linum perenne]
MSQNAMEIDQSNQPPSQSQALASLTTGPLSSSLSSLAASSRAIPSNKDFHFFNNFDEFKTPVNRIASKSHSLLGSIGSSGSVFKQKYTFPSDIDSEEASDWLVNVNDEVLERFDSSVDEFEAVRKGQEESAKVMMDADGFQTVYGRNKKKNNVWVNPNSGLAPGSSGGETGVKVADKKGNVGGKAKVPFHIPTIRRPQEEHSILVNNANQPFEHVWLERSADGSRFVHPLEKLSVLDFVDKDAGNIVPVVPPAVESTPFKLVEGVKDLKEMAAKLRDVNEFAVDLEHNSYRSFQGLTCLMQISTRTEDFIVDTLKLRIHVGPYLREVFKDPTKKKVLHGANSDILWLQRDFGIYVCNMFDTGQASRILKMERNSLEHLLHHFCGVVANKEYQNADWRLRPLPVEMVRYAREDTHYLLYIYDLMRGLLHSLPKEAESSDTPLEEVYKRSYEICMQLYEKDLFTENSYLHMYGLPSANFDNQQLAIVAGLYEWRDVVARTEDESTGYILPNKVLLEIAKQMPVSTGKLRRAIKLNHQYIERHLSSVLQVVRHQMQNAAAFEPAVQQLKEMALEMAARRDNMEMNDDSKIANDDTETDIRVEAPNVVAQENHITNAKQAMPVGSSPAKKKHLVSETSDGHGRNVRENGKTEVPQSKNQKSNLSPTAAKTAGTAVQVQKKQGGIFGAMLGNAAPKKRVDTDNKDKRDTKLEKIKSSVSLPFHSFAGGDAQSKPAVEEAATRILQEPEKPAVPQASRVDAKDIIMLDSDSSNEELEDDSETKESAESPSQRDDETGSVSLSDLSSSFVKCFQSGDKKKKKGVVQEPSDMPQVKPFDYATASETLFKFEKEPKKPEGDSDQLGKKRSSAGGGGGNVVKDDDGSTDDLLRPGRRRQAFPATGNRSISYR